jgi:hypothetical protein
MIYNCKICRSKDKKKINRLLLSKNTYASISKKFNISYKALKKHEKEHLSKEVSKSMIANMTELKVPLLKPKKELPQLENLSACISYVYNEFLDIHLRAKDREDDKINMMALKNIVDSISVITRGKEMEFAYKSQASWDKVLPFIVRAVKDMPEARDAINYAIDKARTKMEPSVNS